MEEEQTEAGKGEANRRRSNEEVFLMDLQIIVGECKLRGSVDRCQIEPSVGVNFPSERIIITEQVKLHCDTI